MKTSLMPCSRKAASQSRLSTFLTIMRGPTQVFWTVETVLGMWVFPYVIVYVHFFYVCPHFSGSVHSNYKWVALLDIFSLLLYLLPAHPSV